MPKKKKPSKTPEMTQTVSVITLEKTILQRAYEYSLKRGYGAILEGGILLFPQSDNNKRIMDDLISQFGYERKEEIDGSMKTIKRLPFSYGFTDIKHFAGKRVQEDIPEDEDDEEEREEDEDESILNNQ